MKNRSGRAWHNQETIDRVKLLSDRQSARRSLIALRRYFYKAEGDYYANNLNLFVSMRGMKIASLRTKLNVSAPTTISQWRKEKGLSA